MSTKKSESPGRKAADIANSMRVFDNVYAIVPSRGPVTFHSQQRRAFNLIWSLFETKVIDSKSRIAIVGAGLAGITAASATKLLGCDVSLFEKNKFPFHDQRSNHIRFIHPNILDWPKQSATNRHTELPYLNWTAKNCDEVIQEIESQWSVIAPLITFFNQLQVTKIRNNGNSVFVTVNPFNEFSFDCVIACIGFGSERAIKGDSGGTYWENNSYHQPNFSFGKRILVSGTGDGGLIDFARLTTERFEHDKLTNEIAEHAPLNALAPKILQADKSAKEATSLDEASSRLLASYTKMKLEENLPAVLTANIRQTTGVSLNGSYSTPFQTSSSILNRVIFFGLMKLGKIQYHEGRLASLKNKKQQTVATFGEDADSTNEAFDVVIVRHGPNIFKHFSKLFGKDAAKAFLVPKPIMTQAGDEQFWPREYFKAPSPGPEYLDIARRRAADYFRSFEQKVKETHGEAATVHIEEKEGHAVYVVSVSDEKRRPEKEYARIPIEYRQIRKGRVGLVTTIDPARYRPLVCGIGIQNFDFAAKSLPRTLAYGGTLGCFVRTLDGRPAILTARHVLSGSSAFAVGELVVQPAGSTTPEADGIARLEASVPLRAGSFENVCEVGIAALLPGVQFVPTFLPQWELPLPKLVAKADQIERGMTVFVAGAASGPTRARIIDPSASFSIHFPEGPHGFRDCILVTEIGADTKAVTNPGDSGALLLTEDGALLGMIFASSSEFSVAFKLEPAFKELRCELINFIP